MKKFIVKFGYFRTEDDTETSAVEDQDNILKSDIYHKNIIKQNKEEILLLLKKNPSISKIFPMENDLEIKNLFADSYFGEPIKFKIKLPFKNQDLSQTGFNPELIEIDEFNILLDQNQFAIYQEVPQTKYGFNGGPDVREKIGEILNELFPYLRFVPPTPFRKSFVYLVSYEDKNKIEDEMEKYEGLDYVHFLDQVDFEAEIYRIFYEYEFHLGLIYETFEAYHKINAKANEIIETQKKLKRLFSDFINSNLLNIIIHNKNTPIKQLNQTICQLLLDYLLSVNLYEQNLSEAKACINQIDTPLENFLEDLESETNIYIKINVDAMFKYTENIINELNTKSINISTIGSGIIGGVIGAISAIIITLIK